MCDCFRDRVTVEIHQSAIPSKRYQLVRSPSIKSHHYPPVTTITRRPSPETKPVKDTFQPREGEDLPLSTQHGGGGGGGQTQNFHPLPPILHQPPTPPPPQQQQHHYHHHNQGQYSSSDNSTVIVDDRPERVVSRLPRRDGRGRRLVRVHRRSNPSSSARRDARSNGGEYYYYSVGSDGGYSWDRGTVKSEWGDDWSDGGDSWDGGARQGRADGRRSRAIEWSGRRRIEGEGRNGRRGGYYLH